MKKIMLSILLVIATLTSISCMGSHGSFTPSAKDKKVVMKIGGNNVEFQEFRYYFLNNKRDNYGSEHILSAEDVENLKALSEENAKKHEALLIMADKYDAQLTKEQKDSIGSYVDGFRENNFDDDNAYLLALESKYMTHYLFKELYSETTIATNIVEKMKESGKIATDDASVDAALGDDGLICIKEIYIEYTSEEMKAVAQKEAEDVLGKLVSGEDFEALMIQHSDYSESSLPPEHGYYTTQYDALEEIWETAINLAPGEYSRVVESPYGFHIVMRCEKDYDYLKANREEIFEICAQSVFWQEFYSLIESLTVEYTDYGMKLDLANLE